MSYKYESKFDNEYKNYKVDFIELLDELDGRFAHEPEMRAELDEVYLKAEVANKVNDILKRNSPRVSSVHDGKILDELIPLFWNKELFCQEDEQMSEYPDVRSDYKTHEDYIDDMRLDLQHLQMQEDFMVFVKKAEAFDRIVKESKGPFSSGHFVDDVYHIINSYKSREESQ